MILFIGISFIFLFILSVLANRNQNLKFQKKLNNQNLNIILVNRDEMDVKTEFFKKKQFFELNDTGKNPSEIKNIKFVRYSTNDDYFLRFM